MTIEELAKSDKVTITVSEAANLLGVDPRTVSRSIQGVPHICMGRRTLILVKPFLTLLGY
jgi:DNA-binding transcriptional regulator YdaS (Cro superfamily)